MKIIKKPEQMQRIAVRAKKQGKTVGFVPTMGYLHQGHLSLIKQAKKENDVVVVSIFVNPLQFGPREDFKRYPRDLKRDVMLCRRYVNTFDGVQTLPFKTKTKDAAQYQPRASHRLQSGVRRGVDFLFCPEPRAMYPKDFLSTVNVKKLGSVLCGKSRPGHFDGVATVVAKLFNIVLPDKAYFGQKDAQQSVIIKKMVTDLNMPIQIRVLPIVRERDGLAMSSRNKYLSAQERKEALVLYYALRKARELIKKGIDDCQAIIATLRYIIEGAPSSRIDYISIVDAETLEPLAKIKKGALVILAVFIGKTRLIDNIIIG